MHLRGVYTALVTPFTEADALDGDALAALTRHVVDHGGEGVVVLGTTGEGYAVDPAERAQALRVVHDAAAGEAGLIAGATASSTREAIANVELARAAGYGTVMIAPPPYALPDPRELAEHYRAISRATDTPIVLYDFPARVGVSIGFEVLDALADVEQVVATKEASGDLGRVIELRARYGDRYEIVSGADALIVDVAQWGAQAWITGGSGVLPAEFSALLARASAGDLAGAREQLAPLLPFLLDLEAGHYTQKVRAGLAACGLPAGHARLPMLPLPEDEREAFVALVHAARKNGGPRPLDGS